MSTNTSIEIMTIMFFHDEPLSYWRSQKPIKIRCTTMNFLIFRFLPVLEIVHGMIQRTSRERLCESKYRKISNQCFGVAKLTLKTV